MNNPVTIPNRKTQSLSYSLPSCFKISIQKEKLQKNQINFENQPEKFTLVKSISFLFNKTAIK